MFKRFIRYYKPHTKMLALDMLAAGLKKYPKCNYLTLRFYRTAGKLYRKLQQWEQAELCRRRICEFDKDLLLYED